MSLFRRASVIPGQITIEDLAAKDKKVTVSGDDIKVFEPKPIDQEAENMILLGIRAPQFIKDRKRGIIYQNDTIYIYWDMFISIILLISCCVTPLNFAFQEELESIQWYVITGYIIDLFFAMEIIINFNSAIVNEIGDVIDDRKAISK
jgi:hypothetical protein